MDERLRKIWLEAEQEFYASETLAGSIYQPRVYADTPSFMEVPVAYAPQDLQGADAVFLGFPWEGSFQINSMNFATYGPRPPDPDAVISRSGAYLAPAYIRQYSIHCSMNISGGYYPDEAEDFRIADYLKIMDYRDVKIEMWDVEESSRRATEMVTHIVKAGAVPLVLGGDHSVPYPIVKGISNSSEGRIGVINFDSHYDIGLSGRLNSGNAFGKIMENCQADPSNLVIIGIKGGAVNTPRMHQLTKEIGATVFTMGHIEAKGIEQVTREAIEIAGRGTDKIYVSFDSDVMDPLTFPAMKYPDAFGLTAWQARDAIRILSREANLCGFDLVCVGPDYDHKGVGALTAVRFYIEVLKGLALRKAARV
jgi:arginase family enzyme